MFDVRHSVDGENWQRAGIKSTYEQALLLAEGLYRLNPHLHVAIHEIPDSPWKWYDRLMLAIILITFALFVGLGVYQFLHP